MTTTLAPSATQTWQIDPTHSAVSFAVRHMMFATVRGQFGELAGTVSITDG
ncbi:MAG: YceI family protein, partial [Gemmatimonadetes bacterium]|nr:YceI family protein [Gemmatimonadota bacterium]